VVPKSLVVVSVELLLERTSLVAGLLHAQVYEELGFYDNLVFLYFREKGMFLQNFIVGTLSSRTKCAVAIHPPPEALARGYYCCGKVNNVEQLAVGWVSR